MVYDKETVDELVDSHDELMLACKAMMSCILKYELLDALDGFLFSASVEPGFSDRAEEARRKMMRERIMNVQIN